MIQMCNLFSKLLVTYFNKKNTKKKTGNRNNYTLHSFYHFLTPAEKQQQTTTNWGCLCE